MTRPSLRRSVAARVHRGVIALLICCLVGLVSFTRQGRSALWRQMRICCLLLPVLVSEETRVQAAFPTALARLANLARGGSLLRISEDAYGDAAAGLLEAVPAPRAAQQIRTECRYLATRRDSAVVTLHWEVTGAAAAHLPVLDADLTVLPAGDDATLLRFDGAYPAPLGAPGAGPDSIILHHVASATIRTFAGRIADLITAPDASPHAPIRGWTPV